MARRRSFLRDFADGFSVANKVVGAFRDAKMGSEIADVDQQYTPTKTDVASGEDALNHATQAKEAALSGVTNEAEIAQINAHFQPTLDALQAEKARPAGAQYSMGTGDGFRQSATPFSTNDVAGAKARAKSDIYAHYGQEDAAARVMRNEASRRTLADDDEIRTLLAGDNPEKAGQPGIIAKEASAGQGAKSITGPIGMTPRRSYLDSVGPDVMNGYLRQGKVAEAKAWRDFTESEQGHAYANKFAAAKRLVDAGDYDAAVPALNELYTQYPDGRRAQTEHIGDGQYRVTMIDEQSGKPVGQRTMSAADLGKHAINALAPTKMVEFTVQQSAKRDAEAATLNKSLQLEYLRQQGQDVRDDRRDDRLTRQLGAMDSRLTRQLDSRERSGGLTSAQQRSNMETDAAREMVAGLSDDDIRQRTAPTTATGRINDLFDPALARAAKLAGRRKIGEDSDFDQRQGRQQSGNTFAGKPLADMTEAQLEQFGRQAGAGGKQKIDTELARRSLAGMPNMQGHSIGQYVDGKGFQVLDAQGRPVSYMRRKAQ